MRSNFNLRRERFRPALNFLTQLNTDISILTLENSVPPKDVSYYARWEQTRKKRRTSSFSFSIDKNQSETARRIGLRQPVELCFEGHSARQFQRHFFNLGDVATCVSGQKQKKITSDAESLKPPTFRKSQRPGIKLTGCGFQTTAALRDSNVFRLQDRIKSRTKLWILNPNARCSHRLFKERFLIQLDDLHKR